MLPAFLVPETEICESGSGESFDLGASEETRPDLVLVTLGVTHIVEQESLDIALFSSADNIDWSPKPLLSFPQKFYCGTYQMLLDLSARKGVRYLKPRWSLNRWGRGSLQPLFGIYLFLQEQKLRVAAQGAS